LRKLLFVVFGVTVLALIWAARRARGQDRQPVGTAPAGAPPMRERDPAAPAFRTDPALERPGPRATSGMTTGAAASAPAAAAVPGVSRQPAPVAEADAPGTASPERLAAAGPDMAAWTGNLVGDTEPSGPTEATAPDDTAETEVRAAGEATAETEPETIPTPAEETTAIAAEEGKDWIEVNGAKSCPPEFPIKGNATSRIYHKPGEPTYEATVPELCFATEEAAIGLGYRARKR
jgi:hypothetical protein